MGTTSFFSVSSTGCVSGDTRERCKLLFSKYCQSFLIVTETTAQYFIYILDPISSQRRRFFARRHPQFWAYCLGDNT